MASAYTVCDSDNINAIFSKVTFDMTVLDTLLHNDFVQGHLKNNTKFKQNPNFKTSEMDPAYANKVQELKSKIKSYSDFPKKGILFWDIFSALSDGPTCSLLQSLLIETIRTKYPDVEAVVGLEARGFLFSFSVAAELGIACLPIRKKGKLPGEVLSYQYDLEYGSDVLQIQKDSIRPGVKCLIIDDLLATGGSIAAAAKLLQNCEANILGSLVIMELTALKGRNNIPDGISVHSLITYD